MYRPGSLITSLKLNTLKKWDLPLDIKTKTIETYRMEMIAKYTLFY